jgi:hypothetical protein
MARKRTKEKVSTLKVIAVGVILAVVAGLSVGANLVLDRYVVEPSWGSWNHIVPQRREVVEWESYKRGWWSIRGRCRVSPLYLDGDLTELFSLDLQYGSDLRECEEHFKNNPPPTFNPQAYDRRKHSIK